MVVVVVVGASGGATVVVVVVVLVVVGGSVVVVGGSVVVVVAAVVVVAGGAVVVGRPVVGLAGSAGLVGRGGGSDATIVVVVTSGLVSSGLVVPERVGSVVDPPRATDVVVADGTDEPVAVVGPVDPGTVDDSLDAASDDAVVSGSVAVPGTVVVLRSISTVNGSLPSAPHEASTVVTAVRPSAVTARAPIVRNDCMVPPLAQHLQRFDRGAPTVTSKDARPAAGCAQSIARSSAIRRRSVQGFGGLSGFPGWSPPGPPATVVVVVVPGSGEVVAGGVVVVGSGWVVVTAGSPTIVTGSVVVVAPGLDGADVPVATGGSVVAIVVVPPSVTSSLAAPSLVVPGTPVPGRAVPGAAVPDRMEGRVGAVPGTNEPGGGDVVVGAETPLVVAVVNPWASGTATDGGADATLGARGSGTVAGSAVAATPVVVLTSISTVNGSF